MSIKYKTEGSSAPAGFAPPGWAQPAHVPAGVVVGFGKGWGKGRLGKTYKLFIPGTPIVLSGDILVHADTVEVLFGLLVW